MYEYGCLMVYLRIPEWTTIISSVDNKDLFETDNNRYGKEIEPHCTILYGIHQDVEDDEVRYLFEGIKSEDFDITLEGKDCFYNQDYDVLKINVFSEKLNELNYLAKSHLNYTSQYQDYKPHLTIAYLKKCEGAKYIDDKFRTNIDSNSIKKLVYSKTNGDKIDISIN